MQPGSSRASVDNVASFETNPEVNSRADSLPWRSASSFSSSTWKWLVPEMFRVPPDPAPALSILFHRREHLGVLAHAEIIVAAPDCYRLNAIRRVMHRSRELTLMAQNIREHPIAPFALQLRQIVLEDMAVCERHLVPTLPRLCQSSIWRLAGRIAQDPSFAHANCLRNETGNDEISAKLRMIRD